MAETPGAGSADPGAPDASQDESLARALAAALWDSQPGAVEPLPTDVGSLLGNAGTASVRVSAAPVHDPYDPTLPATLAPPGGWDTPEPTPSRLPVQQRPVDAAPAPVAFEPPEWLLERLDELLRLESRHADHVSTLLAQTEKSSEDLARRWMDPLLLQLVRLSDRMLAMSDPTVDLLLVQLMQILEGVGVESYTPTAGERFDAARHRGVNPVTTADPALDGCISRTVAPGWRHADGRLLRVADVEVHRLRADDTQDDQASKATGSEIAADMTEGTST